MQSRIIVADDHPLFRDGLRRVVQRLCPDLLIEEAGSLEEVLRLAREPQPLDSLILDLNFPGLDSLERLAALRQEFRTTSLIIVSMVDSEALIAQVMATGVDGFIGKSIAPDEIGKSIMAIRDGEFVVRFSPPGSLFPAATDPRISDLTPRQQDVLRLLASGQTNKEIARALDISPFTVRIHMTALTRALKVKNRSAAAALAATLGLV